MNIQTGVLDIEMQALWLRFIRDRRWSRLQKRQLLEHFLSVEKVLNADSGEVKQVLEGRVLNKSPGVDEAKVQAELNWLMGTQNFLITYFDDRYPDLLRQINDPPIALFASGDLSLLDSPKVAIVGSRRPTPLGVKVTQDIAASLSKLGVAVVSGMALGIDGVAHVAALNSNGPSIAVVGSGLDVIYPSRHVHLFQQLVGQGLVLSEYPLGFKPTRYTFPERNRLVSGLSLGVVIVEAAERSGTLITARMSIEQNRELMVVPGAAVSRQYAGSHRLIKDGAALVCSGQEVIELLSGELSDYCALKQNALESNVSESTSSQERVISQSFSPQQNKIFALLDYESSSVDFLIQKSSLTAAEVSAILLELELLGVASTAVDGGYVKTA